MWKMGAASQAIALRTPETVRRRDGHCMSLHLSSRKARQHYVSAKHSGKARLQLDPIAVASHRESSEYGLRTRSNTTC